MNRQNKLNVPFDDKLEEFKKLVESIRTADTLEQSIERYKSAKVMEKELNDYLDQAEQKIMKWENENFYESEEE